MISKKKGYRVERKIRILFEKYGWKVVRAGASLGEADLICLKNKKCVLLQIKSTRKKVFYFYGELLKEIEGFPFFLVVDFGYGNIRILKPVKKVTQDSGKPLKDFLENNKI
jgi:Holliday junction resolvase